MSVLNAAHFHNEAAAYDYVEARVWANGVTCPHCGNADESKIGKLGGKSTRIGVRKCYACRKPFTVKIGTIFEASHIALHLWLQAIYLMASSKKGISSNQLHRTLGVTLKTAWFMSHRIREAMTAGGFEPMGGEGQYVEADTTFIGGREKNKHVGKRDGRKIGGVGKQVVHTLVERGGKARSVHVANVSGATLRTVLAEVDRASVSIGAG